MNKPTTDHSLDRRHIRRAFDSAAGSYDEAAVLQRHVADELMVRLSELAITPRRILDLGSGTGYLTRMVAGAFPQAETMAMDLSPAMSRSTLAMGPTVSLCGDAEHPPFAAASFDLVVSSMTLQWCDHQRLFERVRELLRPDGLWLFSSVGPDTLQELRQAWRSVDGEGHVHDFVDMHHLGDALLALGFGNPVLDMDRVNLTYPDLGLLLRDLRSLGVVNARRTRSRGLLGRARYRALTAAYESFREPGGDLPSTWEVIYGHAWCPGPVRVEFDPAGRA